MPGLAVAEAPEPTDELECRTCLEHDPTETGAHLHVLITAIQAALADDHDTLELVSQVMDGYTAHIAVSVLEGVFLELESMGADLPSTFSDWRARADALMAGG